MIEVTIDDGTGALWQYTMTPGAEQLLAEFGACRWSEIVLVEAPPEIRRMRPMKLTIRREGSERCEHCLAQFPPITGGSDVCSCPCHKTSYFQGTIGWMPPRGSAGA